MKNPILQSKRELIHWINHLDDLKVITELLELKEKNATAYILAESQSIFCKRRL